MRLFERIARVAIVLAVLAMAGVFAYSFGTGKLLQGLEAAHAVTSKQNGESYDLTQLTAVNETLKKIKNKYVDPDRVKARQMFLSALNEVQKEVAPVIVLHEEKAPSVIVRVHDQEKRFRVDNVLAHWDVAARLREVFAFLQSNLSGSEVDLREIEYAACNGMLRTLDPHSVFLSPEAFREMNLSTSGKFGGLGIVISIRDQMLTVMRPMPGTPAGRAKLERLDRITKINNESTLNMPLDDAVKRLRGDPGTKVTIWVHRDGPKGWQGSRPFTLTREQIRISSVDSEDLGDGVGYVRIKQFQQTTTAELGRALAKLGSPDKMKALVLDLRGNPGGLLEQAAKVADKFVSEGVLVATVGNSEGREEKRASSSGTEPNYPIVVLTNSQSASASEIVTGALKNTGRAVVMGQTTFGKGTVQLVFPRVTPDGAALKLTIAQYLTPGDVSIQGVGVPPDIELDPMTADEMEMDLYRDDSPIRERDLSESLLSVAKRPTERPFFKLRYRMSMEKRLRIRELGVDVDDDFAVDFPIEIGKKLALQLPRGPRKDQLTAVHGFLEKEQQSQIDAIAKDLKQLGIDWSAPPKAVAGGPEESEYDVTVSTDRPGNEVLAGGSMKLRVSVTNRGKSPIYQLRAVTKSDSAYFDGRELVFGKIEPGQTKRATVPLGWCEVEGREVGSSKPLPKNPTRNCAVPKRALSRQDVIALRFFGEGGDPPPNAEIRPTVKSLDRPIFAYTYQVADNRPGNGDGQLGRGEGATVYLTVKNVGKGQSYDTQANIRNLTGDGLLLHKGRFDVSNMKPGEVRQVAFTFDVLPALAQRFADLELSVADRDLQVVSSEKIKVPIVPASGGLTMSPATGRYSASKAAPVRGRPDAAAAPFAELQAGSVVEVAGKHGSYLKVDLGDQRFGFVEAARLTSSQAAASVTLAPILSHSPPLLELAPGKLAVRSDEVVIEGTAQDGNRVLDAYIFVGPRKVYYESNRSSGDPKRLDFKATVKLQPGTNVITVVARENDDTFTRYTRVVRRDGTNGEALPTPKSELFGADWEFGGD